MFLANTFTKYKTLYETKNFILRYHLTKKSDFRDAIILANVTISSNRFHPLYHKINEKYKAQAGQLTIHVTPTKKILSNKAFVRINTARRIREAATQALRERGYTRIGKIDGPRDQNGVGIGERNLGKSIPLRGTLVFFPYESAITAEMLQLRVEVQACVDVFIAMYQEALKEEGIYEGVESPVTESRKKPWGTKAKFKQQRVTEHLQRAASSSASTLLKRVTSHKIVSHKGVKST